MDITPARLRHALRLLLLLRFLGRCRRGVVCGRVLVCSGPDLRGGGQRAPGLSPTEGTHQTVHVLFLANDRCLRDYDLVVEHC